MYVERDGQLVFHPLGEPSAEDIEPRAEVADVGAEPAGLPRRIRAHVRPGESVLCTYDDTDGRHGEVESPVGDTDGLVGLRAYDTHAHFFSFVVYQ